MSAHDVWYADLHCCKVEWLVEAFVGGCLLLLAIAAYPSITKTGLLLCNAPNSVLTDNLCSSKLYKMRFFVTPLLQTFNCDLDNRMVD